MSNRPQRRQAKPKHPDQFLIDTVRVRQGYVRDYDQALTRGMEITGQATASIHPPASILICWDDKKDSYVLPNRVSKGCFSSKPKAPSRLNDLADALSEAGLRGSPQHNAAAADFHAHWKEVKRQAEILGFSKVTAAADRAKFFVSCCNDDIAKRTAKTLRGVAIQLRMIAYQNSCMATDDQCRDAANSALRAVNRLAKKGGA